MFTIEKGQGDSQIVLVDGDTVCYVLRAMADRSDCDAEWDLTNPTGSVREKLINVQWVMNGAHPASIHTDN